MSTYRSAHELFVSNNDGTTVGTLTVQSLIIPLTIMLNIQLHHICQPHSAVVAFVIDYCTIPLPTLVIFTVLSDHVQIGLASLAVLCVVLHVVITTNTNVQVALHKPSPITASTSSHLPYLTLYKSIWMICTCIAILAIDFTIFPRVAGKTETYGFSLMDLGVGGFIYSTALTSPTARTLSAAPHQHIQSRVPQHDVVKVIRSLTPVIVLGFVRLLTLKSIDYQEHTSEYGIHWNFFFTIATVSLLSALLQPVLHTATSYGVIGCVLLCVYQCMLSSTSLTDFIMHGQRTNLFSANKEGVFSSVGYLCIYLIGVCAGAHLFEHARSKQYANTSYKVKVCTQLLALSAALYVVTMISDVYIQPASRRMVNVAYAVYAVAYSTLLVTYCLACEIYAQQYCRSASVSPLLRAITRHLLPTFMFANALTGLVNISMQTIYTPAATALMVNAVYMLLVCAMPALLQQYNVTLKV